MSVTALVGTDRAGFLYRTDNARRKWTLDGPLFKGWKVTTAARDGRGRYWAATASQVYGPALHVSEDLKTWRQIEHGPAWPKEANRKLNQIWTIVPAGDRMYAGVDEAGLFASDDGGEHWKPVDGLNEHRTRKNWLPGAGGLCAHAILVDPKNPRRIWVGISAVGVFRSDDGGKTFHLKNAGIPDMDPDHPDGVHCVHGMVADPRNADVIYRREHKGMFRTRDGGESWEHIENGLSGWFGFPITMDNRSGAVYVVPLESDEYRIPPGARLRVYRTRNGGDTWEPLSSGLPQEHAYMSVLRRAMDADQLDPPGIYFGTTSGTVYATNDGGETWKALPGVLPRVLSISVFSDS